VRRKCEHLIVEIAHQRDVLRAALEKQLSTANAFAWQKQMRFYHYSEELDVNKAVLVKMADAVIPYGFEYLGICQSEQRRFTHLFLPGQRESRHIVHEWPV
jgi:dynein heavy chain 1